MIASPPRFVARELVVVLNSAGGFAARDGIKGTQLLQTCFGITLEECKKLPI